jgi:uncharacterized RDD family membrane protein YckC
MRCPKCRYIGFEERNQCRNCGYDFSFTATEPALDLPMRGSEAAGPLADIRLTPSERRRASAAALTPPAGFDLPLFNGEADDTPLVDGSAAPRAPLVVRRAAPVIPRVRTETPVHEERVLEFPEPAAVVDRPSPPVERSRAAGTVDTDATAPAGPRLLGATIDALIIGATDLAVLYFTLELCGLRFADVRALPVVPMLAFLLILNGGYLTMFTAAGGQTIGKMIARTRVVPATPAAGPQRLLFGAAVVRAGVCVLSILPAGAGFFLALFRADGRALHDAVADTRVIKA